MTVLAFPERRRPRDFDLADDLADVLAKQPRGLPCETLARSLRRRTADVLAELRADPRFAASGTYRRRRWTLLDLDAESQRGRIGEGLGGHAGGSGDPEAASTVREPESGS